MGLLRTFYALSVVLYHAWPAAFVFVGGQNAVQCFYIISGFLISYILVERRSYRSLGAFYLSRYLRLYPVYILVAALSLAALLAVHERSFLHVYQDSPAGAVALLVFSNLFLFGQDWVMFCAVQNHALVLVTNFNHSEVLLWQGQIIHPSWTLGIELSFYAIAPFVLPRRWLVFSLLAASLLLRLVFIHLGFGTRDPWSYRFFPTELALFLSGALAQQLLLPLCRRLRGSVRGKLCEAATYFLLGFSAVYFLIPLDEIYRRILLLGIFAVLVPFTFLFQERHRFDGWIGELSYPIYISHMLMLWVSSYVLKRLGVPDQRFIAAACVILTIAFSLGLNHYVARPIEALRHRLRGRSSVGAAAAAPVAGLARAARGSQAAG